jgi:16S rRNA (uracil1498-N3)-methyltransferase
LIKSRFGTLAAMPRVHVAEALSPDLVLSLPPGAARHVQVLRLQPGATLTLFNGDGGEWDATVLQMGRSTVEVRIGEHRTVQRELPVAVTLAVGMPANDRMDGLVEKATELGVAAIQPLVCERSVLRLSGERAERKREHWQGVAVAASEQSGRTRVPRIGEVCSLADWLRREDRSVQRHVLSLGTDALACPDALAKGTGALSFLSGPEGGLSPGEEAAARAAGWLPLNLGPRTLRADTAPLAVLAFLAAAY